MGLIERIKSEYAYLTGALTVLRNVTLIAMNPERSYPDVADDLARDYGDRIALVSDSESLTFSQYNNRANQYARWAIEQGIRKGDVVTLMMPNRPEYLAIWLGIIRAGGITALLNTNLNGPALAHCVNI
ncbi:MAG TPA: AMP-binding protein, partial [Afifellaceae bacterium]|nr:AMP-binding protein [Afifellaceae bacterium]